ncbi:alpha/beta fold hydrolase [Mycetocola sp. 2940]|uniref:alpha/beta hydrolase family protein n=1 Tax=Mycetocola sp. 2940 TaxID=3156452 RepID=UPI0033951B91
MLSSIVLEDGTSFDLRAASAGDARRPIAVILPALGAPSRFYERFARRLCAAGLTSITVDLRGQGDSGLAPGPARTNGYKEIVETDFPRVISTAAGLHPGQDIWLIGHSLGGQLGLVFTGLHPGDVAGVVLIATGSAWYRGFRGINRIRNLVGSQLIALISRCVGYWPGAQLGFGGRQSTALMVDWAAQVRTGTYRARRSTVDYEAAMRGVRTEVHFIEVEGDTLAPQGCVDHLSGKLPGATLTRWRYYQQESSTMRLSHFSWARESPGLAEDVAAVVLTHGGEHSALPTLTLQRG